MARFYGWTPDQIGALTVEDYEAYWRCITVLEAREVLVQLRVQDWSNMKDSDRKSFHGKIKTDAYPPTTKTDSGQKLKKISNAELAKILQTR